MQTKTYFASNVPAALEVARRELGEDALLVDSKPAPAHARKFGRVEVTFAYDPPRAPAYDPPRAPAYDPPRAPAYDPPTTRIHEAVQAAPRSELDEIRQQIASLRAAVGGGGPVREAPVAGGGMVLERLCEAGLGEESAREIAREAPRTGDPETAVLQALARRITTAPFGELNAGAGRTLAFVGPPGRGKTTSLVKAAVSLGLARRIPVRIYSAGAHGIGGQEQIARYAAILGVPQQSYESIESLGLALNGDAWKGLALIDTPGISPSERTELRDFGRFFSSRPEIERHLVLRADARSADMFHVIATFAGLSPSRLLFTGVDEAVSAGAMAEVLMRGGIPATFLGTGQGIPDDFEEADAGKLARSVWAGDWVDAGTRSRAAAA